MNQYVDSLMMQNTLEEEKEQNIEPGKTVDIQRAGEGKEEEREVFICWFNVCWEEWELECDGAISPATVMSYPNRSPHRRLKNDLESGGSSNGDDPNGDRHSFLSPFDITSTKNASIERLRRWRVRFRFSVSL